jgi:putative hydrolase of the HAD superfamily
MVLVFDLDETLYDELTYVLSGFKAVASFVEDEFNFPKVKTYGFMVTDLKKKGRGKTFDNLLKVVGKYSIANVRMLVSVYRHHHPKLNLYEDAKFIFKKYKDIPKYVVTDGNKIVQKRKSEALNLKRFVNKIFITHNYGLDKAKPSTYCFGKISELENVEKKEILYIGDNPLKDFINAKKEGFKTIRIKRGIYKNLKVSKKYDADNTIKSLYELTKFVS